MTDYFHLILRRYERLTRRRLTKDAADKMPDLLNAQMDKALARIFQGPKARGPRQLKPTRRDLLSNAFDTWTHRKSKFDISYLQIAMDQMAFLLRS